MSDFDSVQVAEFLITAIDVESGPKPVARTVVRFDLTGAAKGGWRAERIGRWQMHWRPGSDGRWIVVEWTALEHLRSRASAPVFTEATAAALGRNASFSRQLTPGLDEWLTSIDTAFMPGGMGHHGVSLETPTATASTTSMSPSHRACPTGCSGTRATARSPT